jgi:UDP-N-acetylglucosamine 1-carboxyvinyltransferase
MSSKPKMPSSGADQRQARLAAELRANLMKRKAQARMDRIRIVGGNELTGTIPISGAKNAALPLMIASLLTDETLTLENVPHLADVEQLIRILAITASTTRSPASASANEGYSRTISFDRPQHRRHDGSLRAGLEDARLFWVIGPLLARMGEAKVSLPGGCAIGTRPVDLFSTACRRLAPRSRSKTAMSWPRARNRLKGNRYRLPEGLGRRDPCADDGGVARQGRDGARKRRARARGRQPRRVPQCHGRQDHRRRHLDDHHRRRRFAVGARHRVMPDRIETGTYAMAVAMTGGDVLLEGARPTCCKPRSMSCPDRRRDHPDQ